MANALFRQIIKEFDFLARRSAFNSSITSEMVLLCGVPVLGAMEVNVPAGSVDAFPKNGRPELSDTHSSTCGQGLSRMSKVTSLLNSSPHIRLACAGGCAMTDGEKYAHTPT